MPSYEEMLDYVLDNGKECSCCKNSGWCHGIVQGPDGPVFPACSYTDFNELLIQQRVEAVYKEGLVDA